MTNRIKLTGLYGERTRAFQRKLSRQLFQLSFKEAFVYQYLGSSMNTSPSIDDVQVKVFNEVVDRAYDATPKKISIGVEALPESQIDFSRFGIINPLSNEITIRVHVDEMKESCLGRWIIVGDVLDIPFYSKDCKSSMWEVTDVDDKPSYEKFYITATIKPLGDTRETYQLDKPRSNRDFLEGLQDLQDQEFEDMIPFEGIGDEVDQQEPVDARREEQASFLDDPLSDYDNN